MKLFGRRKRKPFCADLAEHLQRLPREVIPIRHADAASEPPVLIHIDGTLTKQTADQLSEALHREIRRRGGKP